MHDLAGDPRRRPGVAVFKVGDDLASISNAARRFPDMDDTSIEEISRRGSPRPAGRYPSARGALAQLGEHQLCKLGVTGSIPVRSIVVMLVLVWPSSSA
jgi:hypothetical protein